MKITFELADNILEETELNALSFISETTKQMLAREVRRQLTDVYMEKAEFEDLGITKEELKKAVLEKMAERAIENL